MSTLCVKTERGISKIHVGEKLVNVQNYLPHGKTIIITDETVKQYYFKNFPDCPVITIYQGEENKTLDTCKKIYQELIRLGADRETFILGIGGGIVCDITGFAASTYMRGLKFGFVSTTLLSQVDASVGGKNGVNFDSYKNMVGLFCQPEFVICDISLLKTLPKEEISNGFGEIIKHALITDSEMFDFLEKNYQKALNLDTDTILYLVTESVRIKADVVQKDEKETGERRKLNFGHTIGHAIERIINPGHGRAVSMGMAAASYFSYKKGFIEAEDCERISELLTEFNLPVNYDMDSSEIMKNVKKDKKRTGEKIYFVFLSKIGQSRVDLITINELEKFMTEKL